MQLQAPVIKDFINYYFKAEQRAGTNGVGAKIMLLKDRLHLVKQYIQFNQEGLVDNPYALAIQIAEYENPGVRYDQRNVAVARHVTRIKRWLKEYYAGSLSMENATAVKSPQSMSLVPDDEALFKRNLIETVKGVCASALKNGLSDEDIQVILNSGHITAKEERKIQEVKLEFTKFLRDKGITKDVAMQLLD